MMNKKMRLEPKSQTKIKLFGYSGNICAYPNCQEVIINNDEIIIGDICHIEAAEPTGKRYNLNQSPEERRSFDNLILLCKPHHKIVDSDEIKYNVDVLKNMKKEHEKRYNKNEIENFNVFLEKINDKLDEQQKKQNLLFIFPNYDTKKLIGRNDMLETLHKMLTENKSSILMNGIGGIGKTTVALAYCNTEKYKNEYQNIVWVTLTQSLKESIIDTFLKNDIVFKYNDKEDTDRNFKHLLNILKNIDGNNLLVLDNANNVKEILASRGDLEDLLWKLLITSRCSIPQFNEIPVDELSHDEAVYLFLRFYQKDDREMLDELIEQINKHTLLTELLANAANENPELNIRKVYEKLKNWELKTDILQSEILTQHNLTYEEKQRLIKIGNYIFAVFEPEKLNEEEIKYLLYFSILPSLPIKFEDLIKYFDVKDITPTQFNNILKGLQRKGWLIATDKYSYKMHPLIQAVIREKLQPNAENCDGIIISFTKLLYFKSLESPISRKELVPFAESIWKSVYDEKNKQLILTNELASLANNLALILRHLGIYEKALEYQEKSIKIREIVFNSDHPGLAIIYNNIALTYIDLGNNEKALEYQKKALIIFEKVLAPNHSILATNYNNISITYRNLQNYEKAMQYHEKAISISERVLSAIHPDIAQCYNNISVTYMFLDDFEKALNYQIKSIDILEKVLEANHLSFAIFYYNISITYYNMKDYKQAKYYIDKAVEIGKIALPEDHPNLIKSLRWQNIINNALNNPKKDV